MRQRSFLFLVVCLLMFCGKIFGQKNPHNFKDSSVYNTLAHVKLKNVIRPWDKTGEKHLTPNFKIGNAAVNPYTIDIGLRSVHLVYIPESFLSSVYYCNSLGFFCKKEMQLEKITSVPFRFRLGSLDYVNYLEQKPDALKPR
jgi:hypothetical protein